MNIPPSAQGELKGCLAEIEIISHLDNIDNI